MGFGPTAPNVEEGVKAVRELIELLYPEKSTDRAIELLGDSARALLTAKAALTFENIQRFWQDPEWRAWIIDRWPQPLAGPWDSKSGQVIEPTDLDPDFAWLLQDRIQAGQDAAAQTPEEED